MVPIRKFILIISGLFAGIIFTELLLNLFPSFSFSSSTNNYYAPAGKNSHIMQYRRSKLLGYELIPGSTGNINSFGMRDKEYSLEKPVDTFRIMVLGDSITEQYDSNSPWTEYIEEKFNRKGKYEVLNCAVSGYNLYHYWAYLKNKGITFEPDLTVIALCLNDIPYWNCVRTVLLDKKEGMGIHFSVKTHDKEHSIDPTLRINPELFKKFNIYRALIKFMIFVDSKIKTGASADLPLKMLDDMKNITDNNIITILFPYMKPLKDYTETETYDYEYTLSVLKKSGIPIIDLHSFADRYSDKLYDLRRVPEDAVHFNDRFSDLLAENIYSLLSEKIRHTVDREILSTQKQ